MARRQAEVIITTQRPDADYTQMLGTCFAAIRAKVSAALARGLGMRALSYTKYGFRRPAHRPVPFAVSVEQDLHMLGGGFGVSMMSLHAELVR